MVSSRFREQNVKIEDLSTLKSTVVNESIKAYSTAHTVTLAIACGKKTFTASAWNNIGTLPEVLIPNYPMTFMLMDYNITTQGQSSPLMARITSVGAIDVYVFSDRTTLTPYGTVTFCK